MDKFNILGATLISMERAVSSLPVSPDQIFIDGKHVPKSLEKRATAIVRGDQFIPEISGASIIAKVVRDQHMVLLDRKYPGYHWNENAGYGVKKHHLALKMIGVSPIHRLSFRPIHNILCE